MPSVSRSTVPFIALSSAILLVSLSACVTSGTGPGGARTSGPSTSRNLKEIRAYIDNDDYRFVVPNCLRVIQDAPHSADAIEARYWLAIAYLNTKTYRNAIDQFENYLRLAPEGYYAQPAQERLTRLLQAYENEVVTSAKLDALILEATEAVEADPSNLEQQLTLADLHWRRGNYTAAAQHYAQIVANHPTYARDVKIRRRVEFHRDGSYIVLTPNELIRRGIEADPLAIVGTTSFRSGRDTFTQDFHYYSVSGQAINRSESVLYGVEVHVTIYGFGEVIYDSRTVRFGTLNPGESRAFSVRLGNFDNIENIHRYECVGSFQR